MSLQDPYSFDNFSDVDSEKQEVDAEIEQTIRRIEQASPMDVDIPASSQTNAGTIKEKLQRGDRTRSNGFCKHCLWNQ